MDMNMKKFIIGIQLLLTPLHLTAGDGGDGYVEITNLSVETITVSFYGCYVIHLCHEVTLPPGYHYKYGYQFLWTTENMIRVKGHVDPSGFRRPIDSEDLGNKNQQVTRCLYFGKDGDPYNTTVGGLRPREGLMCFFNTKDDEETVRKMVSLYKRRQYEYFKKEKEKEERRTKEELIRQNEATIQVKIEEFKVYLMKYGMDFCSRQEFHDLFSNYKINFCHDGLTVD
ncbi:MAG: hypothetical protein KZQ63_00405 [Candidatus Thiodiazotropha sp. (ex Lucinoma aequizonata)]|nr:hypothetical protein [Candidatus Thiodiazotropha sp. (ex Lucinoma aequizonata)]